MRYLQAFRAVALATIFMLPTDKLLWAQPNDSEAVAATVTVRGQETREFDWAKLSARAQVPYVSSGPADFATKMIDNDVHTFYRFARSDKHPTVIVRLAQSEQLHRVNVVFKAEDAQLEVFLLDALPRNALDAGLTSPVASFAPNGQTNGQASVSFATSNARYIALRWRRTRSNEPFEIAEISAFGGNAPGSEFEQSVHLAGTSSGGSGGSGGSVTDPPPVVVVSP